MSGDTAKIEMPQSNALAGTKNNNKLPGALSGDTKPENGVHMSYWNSNRMHGDEWRCPCCSCINASDDTHCWNCGADEDGNGASPGKVTYRKEAA